MQTEVLFAGFGGQGILFAGLILAKAAMDGGSEVTWIPSYGPEMRGGTASCTVVVADKAIGSPLVCHPTALVALNQPSLDRYESQVKSGGVMIVNASLVGREFRRSDLDALAIPANDIASEMGSQRVVNMVMLGALLTRLRIVPFAKIEDALRKQRPGAADSLLSLNIKALYKGALAASPGAPRPGISEGRRA